MSVGTLGFNVVGEATPIDGTNTGSTKIVDHISSTVHISPLFATFEAIDADSITETAIVSIGTNYPNYDDIVSAHGINPQEGTIETVFLPSSKIIPPLVDVYARVVRAASGTELNFVVGLGYLAYATS